MNVAKDPLCGMTVLQDTSLQSRYGERSVYFCSAFCKASFEHERLARRLSLSLLILAACVTELAGQEAEPQRELLVGETGIVNIPTETKVGDLTLHHPATVFRWECLMYRHVVLTLDLSQEACQSTEGDSMESWRGLCTSFGTYGLAKGKHVERRIYFVLGDLAANASAGIAAGLAATAFIEPGWLLPIVVVLGLLLGSITGLVVSFAYMPFFGAFEVMLPTILSGMTAGTCVATLVAWHGLESQVAAGVGAVLGVAVFVGTYLLDARLHTKG